MPNTSTQNWTANHYLALIMLYGANIDAEINQLELSYMKDHAGAATCDEVKAYFSTLSDYESINTIVALRDRFFPGEDGKKQILAALTGIFESDNNFSKFEHAISHLLDKIIQ